MVKARGPRTEPCGTPDETSFQVENSPLSTVLCDLSLSQSCTHASRWPPIPCASILARRRLCGTLSKALEKSRYITSTDFPSSCKLVIRSKNSRRLVVQDLFLRNPCLDQAIQTAQDPLSLYRPSFQNINDFSSLRHPAWAGFKRLDRGFLGRRLVAVPPGGGDVLEAERF